MRIRYGVIKTIFFLGFAQQFSGKTSFEHLEAYANGRNIVGQHATLLGPTSCVRLHGTTTILALFGPFRPVHANGRNIVGQHATLLGPTSCVRLHGITMLALFGTFRPVHANGRNIVGQHQATML